MQAYKKDQGDEDGAAGVRAIAGEGSAIVSRRIAIVGGGMSGLTAAWRLSRAGHRITVFEALDRPGGRTRSVRQDGFVFDVGAITMLPTYRNTVALATELGLTDHLHRVTPVIGVPRDGTIHRLDLARPIRSLLSTRLVSTSTKLRLLRLALPLARAWGKARFDTLAPLAGFDDVTVGDAVRRLCGAEAATFVAGPVIRGNTLNSIDCAPFGELLWMLRQYAAPHLFGFDQGINGLAEALAGRLPVRYETPVARVERHDRGVTIHGDGDAVLGQFDGCVIAQPPSGVLALAPRLSAGQRAFLAGLRPLRSLSLHVGLSGVLDRTETFILPPVSEAPMLTTIVLDHLKAPGRAPPGKGVVSFFMSDDWYEDNAGRSDDALRRDILAMAEPFIGRIEPMVESFVVSRWDYAVIKSDVGLYRRIAAFERGMDASDHVQLAGDFLSMGIEAAVISGETAAARLAARFTREAAVS